MLKKHQLINILYVRPTQRKKPKSVKIQIWCTQVARIWEKTLLLFHGWFSSPSCIIHVLHDVRQVLLKAKGEHSFIPRHLWPLRIKGWQDCLLMSFWLSINSSLVNWKIFLYCLRNERIFTSISYCSVARMMMDLRRLFCLMQNATT